jgi:hypothetical protein
VDSTLNFPKNVIKPFPPVILGYQKKISLGFFLVQYMALMRSPEKNSMCLLAITREQDLICSTTLAGHTWYQRLSADRKNDRLQLALQVMRSCFSFASW